MDHQSGHGEQPAGDSNHSHQEHHGHGKDHGHGHGHHAHHEARHFTELERLLHGVPKNAWNRCTDNWLEYRTCVREKASGRFPFGYIMRVSWADRWYCQEEDHAFKECELLRTQDIFEANRVEIAANR